MDDRRSLAEQPLGAVIQRFVQAPVAGADLQLSQSGFTQLFARIVSG